MGKLSRPRQLGLDLLVEVGARSPADIDPIESAKERGVEIVFGHLSGAAARIYRHGTKARIRVSNEIQTEARRRSSIMHELGHLLLEHVLPREGDAASWFATCCAQRSKTDERDADVLCVEHLTPTRWVRPYCNAPSIDLDVVQTIERTFRVSPVMAALRLVELSSHACAVVYAEAGRVRWMKPSRTFPGFVAKGEPVAAESISRGFFDTGTLHHVTRRCRAASWVPADVLGEQHELEIVEHARVIPEAGWGGVMSLLSIPGFAPTSVKRKDRKPPETALSRRV